MNQRDARRFWFGAGIASLLAFGAAGCDTVALISFQEREFQSIDSPGFTAPAGSCGGIDDGTATLRFVLMADDSTPIRPGEVVGKQEVALSADDIEFGDTSLFETPDLPCQSNGDCRLAEMECGYGPSIPEEVELRVCKTDVNLVIAGDVQFESDTKKNQLFGVLYENSGSLQGWLPKDVGEKYPDWDGDGTAEGSDDVGLIKARASDPSNTRASVLFSVITNWRIAAENARDDGQRITSFGLWQFSGTSSQGVQSLVSEVSPTGDVWTNSSDVAEGARGKIDTVEGTRGNVFQALNEVLDSGFALDQYSGYEKTLLLFVDGPDDLRLPQFSANDVINKAGAMGVKIFIVHLDARQEPKTQAGTPVHRDDFRYWSERVDGQPIQNPCGSDMDCKNFEECRVPVGYSSVFQGSVEIDPMGETYCLPKRDDDGRIGPIAEYARIACETDGGYIYVKDAGGLRPRMDWIPFAMDGLWKVDVSVDALENKTVPSDEVYKLQSTMRVTLGGSTYSHDFSQVGVPATTGSSDGRDSRSVLFN